MKRLLKLYEAGKWTPSLAVTAEPTTSATHAGSKADGRRKGRRDKCAGNKRKATQGDAPGTRKKATCISGKATTYTVHFGYLVLSAK